VRSFGMAVDCAHSGQQALECFEAAHAAGHPYSLVLTDWRMPGLDGVATVQRLRQNRLEHTPAVIMVTAFAKEEVLTAAHTQQVQIDNVLSKPASPSSLLEAIGAALNKGQLAETRAMLKAESHDEAMAQLAGARVLLVEDNDMNQELAIELLEQAGMQVVLAENGQEALDILNADARFDGVLMDCQMPVMDGYTATRLIRAEARWQHIPVIAMTANAMAGDREKVLEAGMVDHIAKPLNVGQMFRVLARWIQPAEPRPAPVRDDRSGPPPGGEAPTDLPALPCIDTRAGLATCMGNPALYRRMLLMFVDSQGDFAQHFNEALRNHQPGQAERLAHTLKSTAGNIGARGLQAVAGVLEGMCRGQASARTLQVKLAELDALLQLVLVGLRPLRQADEAAMAAPAAPKADPAVLGQATDELVHWLESADSRALTHWHRHHATFLAGYPMHARKIGRAMEDFDFERALEVLQEAASTEV